MDLFLQSILLFFCFAGSSLFAGVETGFVSWNPLKISHRALLGDIVARWADFLMHHKDRLLSAVLIGNNVCIVGASLAFERFLESMDHCFSLQLSSIPSAESLMLTPLMVLFGEMLPKSLFRLYPFRLTMRMTPVLVTIYYVTFPFTWIFSCLTDFLRKTRKTEETTYMAKVREEMVLVAQEGSKSGTLFRSADKFIQNLMEVNNKTIGEMFELCKGAASIETGKVFNRKITVETVLKELAEQKIILIGDGTRASDYINLHDLAAAAPAAILEEISHPLPVINGENPVISLLREDFDTNGGVIKIENKENNYLGTAMVETLLLTALSFDESALKPQ